MKTIKTTLYLWLALFVLAFAGCGDDNNSTPPKIVGAYDARGVFIINEGTYGQDNTSLSFLDLEQNKIVNEVYYLENSAKLGKTAQCITVIDDLGFITVTNSEVIKVIDVHTMKHLYRDKEPVIIEVPSPRYVAAVSKDKIYATSINTSKISVIDRTTLKVIKVIEAGTNPRTGQINSTEQIVVVGDYAYVNTWTQNGDQILKIDTKEDKIVGAQIVVGQPNSMVVDKNGKLWVASTGPYDENWSDMEPGTLSRINLANFGNENAVELLLKFEENNSDIARLTINAAGDRLYFLNSHWNGDSGLKGLYAVSITATALPQVAIADGGKALYGLGVDPVTEELFISATTSFTDRGDLYRYGADFKLKGEYKTGIAPGNVFFKAKKQ